MNQGDKMLEYLMFIGIIIFITAIIMLFIIGGLLIFSSSFREVFIEDWNSK
jgi:hypothetical protein